MLKTTIHGMVLAVHKEQMMIQKEIVAPVKSVNGPTGLIDYLHQRKQGL
jgi:hypothetical protein